MTKAHQAKRELCFRRISEICDVAQKAESNPQFLPALLACYPDVDRLVEDFELAHLKLLQDATADFESEDKIRAQFDRMRYRVKTVYHTLDRASRSDANESHSGKSASKVNLPKISLPRFSGDLALWPSFIALYNSSIHNNTHLNAIERYQYLLVSLHGDALNIVKSLPLSAEHYDIAYDSLVARYQNTRKLATHYWHSIVTAKPLKVDSAEPLRKLLEAFNENLRALHLLKFPTDSWDFILLNLMLSKLTPLLREKFEAEQRDTEIPRYEQLTTFLDGYTRVFASLSNALSKPVKSESKSASSVSSFVTGTAECPCCRKGHGLIKCSEFLKLSTKDRYYKAKEWNLCLNCLRLGHRVSKCSSTWSCRTCRAKHHTLLHLEPLFTETAKSPSEAIADISSAVVQPEASLVTMASIASSGSIVLLSTVKAEIADTRGNFFPVRILLDSASQANFITESCIRRGGFDRTPSRMVVLALNNTRAATTRGATSFVLRVRNRDDIRLPIEATILSKISSQLSSGPVELRSWKHLEGLSLADPDYHRPGRIDILLGADNFVALLKEGHRKGGIGEPDALNTVFGWVLMGEVSAGSSHRVYSFVTLLTDLDTTIRGLWEIEDIPGNVPDTEEDRYCENLFARATRRDASGRFVVSYPFSRQVPCFVDSRQIALNRFHSLERRFRTDKAFKLQYHTFMREYLESGHMEHISQPFPVDGRVYYLPHHGVSKLDSETTKLRVVFDPSAKCSNGFSLNQTLLSGPKLQQDILAILVKFRLGSVALTADVKQMFRQILIEPSQRDYQRIVWRFSSSEPISDYRLRTVTFGITPSPYLAIRCLLRLAEEGKENHPLASLALTSSLYVDDVVTSVQSIEQALALRIQLQDLLRGAGFSLRKWASSHPAVLKDLVPEHCSGSMLSFDSGEGHFLKVLGLRWCARSDCFGFQVNMLNRECSKRVILSELARIFDPLGFLAPLTFAAKLLIQRLWTLGLDWDARPPPDICQQWSRYASELEELGSLRIPRSLSFDEVLRRELHGFCDASERGYGAVVYLRIQTTTRVIVRFLSAKSKVAPFKPLTLPRLELCAALLLSELIKYLRQVLSDRLDIDAIHAWSDSMVPLAWIRSSPHRWKTFLRNRVARIQNNLDVGAWGHVGTDSNPADLCSRGLFPRQLVGCTLWWEGPDWLPDFGPRSDVDTDLVETPEIETASAAFFSATAPTTFNLLLTKFSSLNKICRIVAYCSRFIASCRGVRAPRGEAVDQLKSHSALLLLTKVVQAECFSTEMHNLERGRRISQELRKLVPFLDSSGVLRVGGRIVNSVLPYEALHPALLPNNHRLTDLVIESTHHENLHPGRRALHYLIAQHFWVLGIHRAIKRVLSGCFRCFRVNPRIVRPSMAALPAERVTQVKPFSITGVDFAGPFAISPRRTRGTASFKIYVCVFVCFAVKAIHLEMVFSLTTDSFLAALRRFIARRGRCSLIFSDCGTNFIGAHRELEKHMALATEKERIKWSFNPPAAPHFGGLWEAGVKSFKTYLRRVVGDQLLSVEEFSTLLAQIEAVLNSRPLCSVSSDPNDLTVLSPGHFLTTEPLVALPGPQLDSVPLGRLDRWQLLLRMHQDFWRSWHLEYLQTLQQRPKWLDAGVR